MPSITPKFFYLALASVFCVLVIARPFLAALEMILSLSLRDEKERKADRALALRHRCARLSSGVWWLARAVFNTLGLMLIIEILIAVAREYLLAPKS